MTIQRIALVARHVFKENVRDRVLYGIAGFALLLVAASLLLGQITAGQDVKIVKDLGLATIELAAMIMTVFIGVGLVSREIDRRSIYSLLAKPLPRWEFVVGKYAGLVLTVTVNIALMAAALYLVLAYSQWTAPEAVRRGWETPATDPRLFLAVGMIMLEMALLTAIALLVSTFSSSGLWSIVFTVGVLIAGIESQDLRHFGDIVNTSPAGARIVSTIGWIVPAFSAFDLKADVVHGQPISAGYVGYTALYALAYTTAALGGAIAIFSRREFK